MKVLPVSNDINFNHNIKFEGANNTTKIGLAALIVSSSLFMMSNAIDSFEKQQTTEQKSSGFGFLDGVASIAGIVGTFTGLLGLKQDEEDEKNSGKN